MNSYLIECKEHRKKGEPKLWWKPNSRGYTWDIRLAGRYTREEASSIVKGCSGRNETMWNEIEVLTGMAGKIWAKPWDERILVVVGGKKK